MWVRTAAALAVLGLLMRTSAFNLDTLHPVIFQGPVNEPGVSRGASYFGYSVGLTKSNDGAWVLVGAPRATSTLGLNNLNETGALFKCGTRQQPGCREVVLDESDYSRRYRAQYREIKEGAWIGGALDTVPQPDGKISVCGPRWMNEVMKRNREAPDQLITEHYGNGVCYWMEAGAADYNASKVIPLVYTDKQMLSLTGRREKVFRYAYGQAGLSVHFARNGSELLMGAPGVYNWKGSVVRLSSSADHESVGENQRRRRRRRQADYSQALDYQRVINAHATTALDENDFFGYSVSSGEFSDDGRLNYVAGAPRAAYGYGKVFVFNFPPNDLDQGLGPREVLLERTGSQVGGYFGGAVLGLDVSGDGRSELLVGAPLHSYQPVAGAAPTGLEEGRVYVYQNRGAGELDDQPLVLTGDRAVRARFGSAVANVGDLDMDGYNDIAVGAPYEEDQHGAIYIYLGGATGLNREYSQRILASNLSPALRGFGISISHGLDVDDNNYADVAVGSYLSGEAVLLRAQPVLRFHAHLRPNTDKLQPTDKRFEVQACLKYFGRHLPNTIPATIQMKIDSRHVVCVFNVDGERRDNFTYESQLNYGNYKCNNFTVLIESESPDFIQPIQLSMSYHISSTRPEVAAHTDQSAPVLIATDVTKRATQRFRRQASPLVTGDLSEFCATCPVVNTRSPGQSQVTLSVPFSIGCAAVCQSDLSVSASIAGLAGSSFVIGDSRAISLLVNITNAGEPASLPRVQVHLPQPVRLARVPRLCFEKEMADHVLLTCDVRPHPFPPGESHQMEVALDVQDLKPGTESLVIGLNVSSAGDEVVPADNVKNFTLGLRMEADIAVVGPPLGQLQDHYDKEADRPESERNQANYYDLSHRYQVLRYLPSPVKAVTVSFLVPVNMTKANGEHAQFLDLKRTEATIENRPLACGIQTGFYLAADGSRFQEAPRTNQSEYHLTAAQRHLLAEVKLPYDDNNVTTVMNCTQPGVACVLVQCPAVDFPHRQTSMVVTLNMRIKLHVLEPFVGERDTLVISTIGVADIAPVPYPLQPLDDRPDLYQVHTILSPHQPFPIWIIVVTVIGSLLLLALITYGLYKLGFFKRRRPDGVE